MSMRHTPSHAQCPSLWMTYGRNKKCTLAYWLVVQCCKQWRRLFFFRQVMYMKHISIRCHRIKTSTGILCRCLEDGTVTLWTFWAVDDWLKRVHIGASRRLPVKTDHCAKTASRKKNGIVVCLPLTLPTLLLANNAWLWVKCGCS